MIRLLTILILFIFCSKLTAQRWQLAYPAEVPQVQFAVDELQKCLQEHKLNYELISTAQLKKNSGVNTIVFSMNVKSDAELKPEGFSLQVVNGNTFNRISINANDVAGLMYGGLELAEQINVYGIDAVKPVTQNPYMKMRGTKFNIPLDVRTPSYTDMSDAAQQNIGEMWNWDFWKNYIDNLARYRYNFISLWSLHPFPSMVKVKGYEDVALNDVWRSTGNFKEDYSLNGNGFDAPEIMEHTEVLKKMTIDEKIDFWRKVMRYGKERNVDICMVTWNVFVYGTENKYGITDDMENPVTKDYFHRSVAAMIETYPDLMGIGLTTGENMEGANADKEDWAFETYGKGVLNGMKNQPGRKFTFIHRQHQTGALAIADKFKLLADHQDINFIFSFKYAQAHVYSSTSQPYHPDFVKEIQSRGNLKTLWTLRNDDNFYFRWGAPDFVREFIRNIPLDVSEGYYFGSDQYIWGREFLEKFPETPHQLEIEKHWYSWMMWGRLGYDPAITDDRFTAILHHHFPSIDTKKLFTAWQDASMIYPITTGFHWGALDFHWYIEGNQSRGFPNVTPLKFNDLNYFIQLKPHPTSGNMSIPDYVNAIINNQPLNGKTPYEVSDALLQHAGNALRITAGMQTIQNKELFKTLQDIQCMAWLGNYFGYKIKAATDIAFFRSSGNIDKQAAAIAALQQAAMSWKQYATLAMQLYKNPLWTNRVGVVDWQANYTWALKDLALIGASESLPPQLLPEEAKILEAEDIVEKQALVSNKIPGYKGNGYIENIRSLQWKSTVPGDGYYVLHYRYARKFGDKNVFPLIINHTDTASCNFWYTGDTQNWATDAVVLSLKKGEHHFELGALGPIVLDQLAICPFALPKQ